MSDRKKNVQAYFERENEKGGKRVHFVADKRSVKILTRVCKKKKLTQREALNHIIQYYALNA